MKPSRLIRNIVLLQAESKLRGIEDLAIKAYRKYLEITDPKYLSELTERNICTIIVHFRQLLQIKRKRDLFREGVWKVVFALPSHRRFLSSFVSFIEAKFSLASAISTAHWDKVPCLYLRCFFDIKNLCVII